MTGRSFASVTLLIAGAVHLSLFGLLPFGWKPLGDILLLALCVRCGVRAVFVDRTSAAPVWAQRVARSFAVYVVVLTVVSITTPSEFVLVVQWARRWLVLALYGLLITHSSSDAFDPLILRKGVLTMALTATVVLFAADLYGLSWPSVVESIESQGGQLVKKVSAPGTFLIVLALLTSWGWVLQRASIRSIGSAVAWAVVFALAIRFRGWWIATAAAAACIPVLLARLNAATMLTAARSLAIAAVAVGAIVTSYAASDATREQVSTQWDWISSAIDEWQSGSGNVRYRLDRDVSRITQAPSTDVWREWTGYGFLPEDSYAGNRYGMTSETNDSGWIEVLVTGGYVAAVMVLLLVGAIVRTTWTMGARHGHVAVGAMAGWLVAGLTMVSSNLLLWDFGFVPLALWSMSAWSEPVHDRRDSTETTQAQTRPAAVRIRTLATAPLHGKTFL